MRRFLRASSAEILKLKRTLALWLALLTPMLIVLLQFVFVLRVPASRRAKGIWVTMEQGNMMWPIFLLPLMACLLTALLNGLEHRENNWKHLFALPVPRWSVYAAKVVGAHVLVAIGSLALFAGTLGAGYALHAMLPNVPFGPAPWVTMLKRLALIFAASGALISIHVWVSARAKTFPLPLGLGVGAVLISLIAARDGAMKYWPWMFPVNTIDPGRWVAALVLGAGGGLLIAVLGAWDTSRRDIL
jgi:ABC-2 type transport system permease protein